MVSRMCYQVTCFLPIKCRTGLPSVTRMNCSECAVMMWLMLGQKVQRIQSRRSASMLSLPRGQTHLRFASPALTGGGCVGTEYTMSD